LVVVGSTVDKSRAKSKEVSLTTPLEVTNTLALFWWRLLEVKPHHLLIGYEPFKIAMNDAEGVDGSQSRQQLLGKVCHEGFWKFLVSAKRV